MYKMLIINPGSTSTKIAIYEDEKEVFVEVLRHSAEEMGRYPNIGAQYEFRKKIIEETLHNNGFEMRGLAAIVSRGGLIKPLESGTYYINQEMIDNLKKGIQGEHASNLGGLIAHSIAEELGIKAYIVDPVVVDEMDKIARFTGVPEINRRSLFHALNQKAVARRAAAECGQKYEALNFIVAHLGGGITVGAHRKGKVVDVNDALLGDGPFTPERAGTIPTGKLVKMCFYGDMSIEKVKNKLVGNAGLMAYLGTNDGREVNKMIDSGNEYAALVYEAMAYNVAKEIGSCAAVLEGKVDAIILTGGLAYDHRIVQWIEKRTSFISKVVVMPGEEEMKALAEGGLRVLRGEEEAKEYQ